MLLVGVIDQTLTLTLTSGSEYELSVFKVSPYMVILFLYVTFPPGVIRQFNSISCISRASQLYN